MKRKHWLAFVVKVQMVLVLSFSFSAISYAESVESESKVLHYVALGDSLTLGYEPGMDINSVPYGFVNRLNEQALFYGRVKATNYGITGLKTVGFKNLIKAINEDKTVVVEDLQEKISDPRINQILQILPQMKEEIMNADLITITIGGNDFKKINEEIMGKTAEEIKQIIIDRFANYQTDLAIALESLFQLNSKAQVVIANQYQPFPNFPGQEELYKMFNDLALEVNKSLDVLVKQFADQQYQIKNVDLFTAIVGKEITHTYILSMDIHPNQLGYEELAKQFAKVIWGEYKEIPKTPSNQAPSIIIQGKELITEFKPLLIDGRTLVPVREYVEALGGIVEWDPSSQSAVVVYQDLTVRYTTNSNIVIVNDQTVELSEQVKLVKINNESKTYVPLRALAEEVLGLDVQYIQAKHRAFINP